MQTGRRRNPVVLGQGPQAAMRAQPDPGEPARLDRHPRRIVWTTAMTVLKARHGSVRVPDDARRQALPSGFARLPDVLRDRRVAPFDRAAAGHAASLRTARRGAGRPAERPGTVVVGIAEACRASLAPRHARSVANLSVPVVDPWAMTAA